MWEKFGHQSKYQKSKQDSRCFQVHSWKKKGCSQIISRMYQNVTGYTTMINMQFIMAQIHHPSSINYPKNLSSITWSSDWFHFGIERISKILIISIDPLAIRNISSQKISKKSRKILRPIRIFGRKFNATHAFLKICVGESPKFSLHTITSRNESTRKLKKYFFSSFLILKNLSKKFLRNFQFPDFLGIKS